MHQLPFHKSPHYWVALDEISVFLNFCGREAAKTRKKAIFARFLSRFGLKTRIIFLSYIGNDISVASNVTQEWNAIQHNHRTRVIPISGNTPYSTWAMPICGACFWNNPCSKTTLFQSYGRRNPRIPDLRKTRLQKIMKLHANIHRKCLLQGKTGRFYSRVTLEPT